MIRKRKNPHYLSEDKYLTCLTANKENTSVGNFLVVVFLFLLTFDLDVPNFENYKFET